jgi:hypothetical protein
MKPQILKLITGEEVIANVKEEGDFYKMKDAFVLVPSREGGVAMVGWMPFAEDGERTIRKEHVVALAEPVAEIKNSYVANTGGIVTASAIPKIQGGLRLSD